MLEICKKEGMKAEGPAIEMISESCGNDVRQVLNVLEMWSHKSKTLKFDDMRSNLWTINKDMSVMLGPFDACSKLLNRRDCQLLTPYQRLSLFYLDTSMVPMMIQEN